MAEMSPSCLLIPVGISRSSLIVDRVGRLGRDTYQYTPPRIVRVSQRTAWRDPSSWNNIVCSSYWKVWKGDFYYGHWSLSLLYELRLIEIIHSFVDAAIRARARDEPSSWFSKQPRDSVRWQFIQTSKKDDRETLFTHLNPIPRG